MKDSIKFGTDGWRGVIGDDFTFANVRRAAPRDGARGLAAPDGAGAAAGLRAGARTGAAADGAERRAHRRAASGEATRYAGVTAGDRVGRAGARGGVALRRGRACRDIVRR